MRTINNQYDTLRGLVLRQRDFKDADKILTVLTDKGKKSLVVSGARKKSSRMRSCCEQLTYNEYTVYEYRDWLYVHESETLDAFQELRGDLDKLFLASYFAELLENLSDTDVPDPALTQLGLNSVYALSHLELDKRIIKAAFELRLMCIAGFMPLLESADGRQPDGFDPLNGTVLCIGDASQDTLLNCVPLNEQLLEAMRYICTCPPKKLFAFPLGEENRKTLSTLTECYVLKQLQRGFSTLDLYNSLQL